MSLAFYGTSAVAVGMALLLSAMVGDPEFTAITIGYTMLAIGVIGTVDIWRKRK